MTEGRLISPTPATASARTTVVGLVAAFALALAALVAPAATQVGLPTAGAHAVLEGSVPEDASEVTEAPDEVRMIFNENINPEFATLVVRGPDGEETDRTDGDPVVSGHELIGDVSIDEPGAYTAAYRVTSADGHVVQGSTSFTVAPDAEGLDGGAANGTEAGSEAGPEANGTGTLDPGQVEPGTPADGALEDNLGLADDEGGNTTAIVLAAAAGLLILAAIAALFLTRKKRASRAPDQQD